MRRRDLLQYLRRALEAIVDENFDRGLCDRVFVQFNGDHTLQRAVEQLLQEFIRQWPERTNDPSFPVPSDDRRMSPRQRYINAMYANSMWRRATEYGAARWALRDFVLEQVNKEMRDTPMAERPKIKRAPTLTSRHTQALKFCIDSNDSWVGGVNDPETYVEQSHIAREALKIISAQRRELVQLRKRQRELEADAG